MELLTYAVPKSLLSSQPAPSSRGGHLIQRSLSELDSRRGKKRKLSAESTSPKSVTEHTELPQYIVPESLLPPLSHAEIGLRTPANGNDGPDPHNIPTTLLHSDLSMSMHSRSKTGSLAHDTPHEARNHSPVLTSMSANHPEEMLPTGPQSCKSLSESLDLSFPFPTTTKDIGMRYDCFLEMSNKNFFPTPSMTNTWEEAPTSTLSEDSVTKQHILLDESRLTGGQDKTSPETYELQSDQGEHYLDTSASTEARLSHVLKAVAAAGFESLDTALVAYYAESLKDDEWPGQEQRLNRIRRLPVLLKELHVASQGWGQWQRRSFQEQVIKSTEDILIAELDDHLAARGPGHHSSTGASGQLSQAFRHKARDEADIEADVSQPNHPILLCKPSAVLTGGNSFRTRGPC
ncbi:hypothetical protein GGI43DRAFT_418566 [Trichoderma evansii]